MFLLTLWGPRALIVLGPPLFALELAMTALSIKEGWFKHKLRGWTWLIRNWRKVWARRRLVQRERTVPNRQWMAVLTDQLDTPLVPLPSGLRGVLNGLMRAYWRVARSLV
jgi:hypothetical protein